MKIHFFTKGDDKMASSRQRAVILAQELQKYQVDTIVHVPSVLEISETPWPKKISLIIATLKNLFSVKKGDVIFLQRTIYNKYFFIAFLLHHVFFSRKIIFDFDDAIYVHSFFKTKILTKIADVVTVGSHDLLFWAEKYNKTVYLIPTCTHFGSLPIKQFSQHADRPFILGWVGDVFAHLDNLRMLVPVFQELIDRGVLIKFILIGGRGDENVSRMFSSIVGLDLEIIDWVEPAQIVEHIHSFDVGLMPLLDTPISRGKCALKVIEYMACGVPPIASPVGENFFVIQDGVNGFLPKSHEEWVSVIEALNKNRQLLIDLGSRARSTVEKMYTYEAQLVRILDIVSR